MATSPKRSSASLVSEDFGFRDGLSPKVKDTLCEEETHFSLYNATEMEAILERRAEGALYDDATESGVLSLCAAIAAQDSGSARQALDLLYQAGELARAAERERINEDDVRATRNELERSQVEHGMRELTRHGHLSLVAVLHLALESNGPFRVRDIYPRYRMIAEQSDIDSLVGRRMHGHLADLAMLGILDRHSRNEGRSGGQYYEYEFSVDLDHVATVVSDFEGLILPRRVVELTQSIE